MKKHVGDYLVTFFVILCSAALLAALTFGLSGRKIRDGDRILYIDFPDISGIKLYSQVRYGGALAGEVREIRHLGLSERNRNSNPENTVRIAVVLDKDLPRLPENIDVGLGSDTLLSEKFVALKGGDPDGGVLQNGAIVSGVPGMDFDRITQKAEGLLASAGKLVATMDPLLNGADGLLGDLRKRLDATMPKLDEFIDTAKEITASANRLIAHANSFIGDNEETVSENLLELRHVLGSLKHLLAKATGFVGRTDAEVEARMEELEVILENLKVATTHAKAITETLGERPSRLIWPSKRRKLPSERTILRSGRPVPIAPLD